MEDASAYCNRFYQSYLVLNFSRMFCDLHKRQAGSKLSGITWAKSNLPAIWVDHIDFCWEERQDAGLSVHQAADPKAFQRSLAFVAYIVQESKQFDIEK